MIHEKNQLYGTFMRTGDNQTFSQYKFLRNRINHTIKNKKYYYYKNYFFNNKNNLKKFWKGINNFLNRNKKQNIPTAIQNKGKTYTDPKDIAAIINSYFTNVAPELVKKLPNSSSKRNFNDFLKDRNPFSFFCTPVIVQEVEKYLASLDHNKANDVYDFPIKLIKQNSDLLSEPLTLIINKSFSDGEFPDDLKYAKVIPLFKGGTKYEAKNYRPISILPLFDRIIEKIMHKKLISFLTRFKLLSPSQYGFQNGKSTSYAILDVITQISSSLAENNHAITIFLDFAKAFDTVNHSILLKKLEHYGIRGINNKWFQSYLSDRKQSVSVSNVLSEPLNITCGVPQGSILGPILFLLYINDISNASSLFQFTLFADDTCLFLKHNNKKELFKTTNNELIKVCDWLIANVLSLNVLKSNYLFFSRDDNGDISDIQIAGQSLNREKSVRYLGIIIDEDLSWNDHLKSISSKILQGIGVLKKLKYLLPFKSLLPIYHSLIQSHLQYGIVTWGSPDTKNIKIINRLVAKCHNILTLKNHIATDLNLLTLNQIFITNACGLLYHFHNKNLPPNICKLFKYSNKFHDRDTRQSRNMGLNIPHKNIYFSLPYFGPSYWNQYCLDIKKSTLKCTFIYNLKKKLLSQ